MQQLEKISHYRVDRLIGAGGMGEVYLAHDERLGRKVALKLLPVRFTTDEERVRRFQREARAASALNHPNIITIYDIGADHGTHYIATEFIEGETLREHMTRRQMSIGHVLDVGIGAAGALAAAHEAGIIHRDIKPENVMVRHDGYVKVLDFGLAKLMDEAAPMKDSGTGAVMGTLLYISPEQARGQSPDARSDIYSLGAVLYEMITGRAPITGENFLDMAWAIAHRKVDAPSRYVDGVPPELDRIVLKALEKERQNRYESARQLLDDLRTLRTELEFEDKLHTLDPHRKVPAIGQQPTLPMTFPPSSTSSRFVRMASVMAQSRALTAGIAVAGLLAVVLLLLSRGRILGGTEIDTVAVLPFVNVSGNPNSEYLSDGIAESVIDNLSQLPGLQVVARSTVFRYKTKNPDPMTIGRELNVRGVVTGQLIQRDDTLIIRAALTDVKKGTQVWGQQYERKLSDVLTLQREMSEEISNQLRTRLSGEERKRLARLEAGTNEAYQLYLKGHYFTNKYNDLESIKRGISYLNQAIEKDPTYALAYAGLADAYYNISNLYVPPKEAMPRAREAAQRAVALDDSLAQAHVSLALAKAWFDWDFKGGEKEFGRAIELNPNNADSHRRYGDFLTATGQFDRAVAEKRKAEQLDPLSVVISYEVGRTLFFARRYPEALEQMKRTLELDDRFAYAHYFEAQIAMEQNRLDDALQLLQKTMQMAGRTPLLVAMWGYANARSGNRGEAESAIAELQSRPGNYSALFLARIHAALGDKDEALRLLKQVYDDRSESIVWLKVDSTFDTLRGDPRFEALVR